MNAESSVAVRLNSVIEVSALYSELPVHYFGTNSN